MIFKICQFKKNFVGQTKEKDLLFALLLFIFSHLQNFSKISIDMHWIALSCHQKFEKNSLTRSENIGTWSWKYGKSHGLLDPTLHTPLSSHACKTTSPTFQWNLLIPALCSWVYCDILAFASFHDGIPFYLYFHSSKSNKCAVFRHFFITHWHTGFPRTTK